MNLCPEERLGRIVLLVTATTCLLLHPAFGAWPGSVPSRIVSTAPAVTEYLFAFGQGARVAAVTRLCDFPPQVAPLPRIAGLQLDLERILAIRPDLVVIMQGLRTGEEELLRSLSLPVLVLNLDSLDGIRSSLPLLGERLACPQAVEDFLRRLDRACDGAEPTVRPSVYLETWGDPPMTAGGNCFINEMIRAAGGRNIFDDLPAVHPQVTLEEIVRRDPQIIISAWPGGERIAEERAILGSVRAVRFGRVHHIHPDLIVRPGPRLLEGLERLRAIIRP